MISQMFREAREQLGYSQVRLSAESGVSLPTIQNIELGKANPSLKTLEWLARTLNLELNVGLRMPDLESLVSGGLPLSESSQPERRPASIGSEQLAAKMRVLCAYLALSGEKDTRLCEAAHALAFAIHKHYPSWYKTHLAKIPAVKNLLSRPVTGRIIKLSRQCYDPLSQIL